MFNKAIRGCLAVAALPVMGSRDRMLLPLVVVPCWGVLL